VYYHPRFFAGGIDGKLDAHLIVICLKGVMLARHEQSELAMAENDILFLAPGSSLTQVMLSADFECIALRVSNRKMNAFLHNFTAIWNKTAYVHSVNKYHLNDYGMQFTRQFHELFRLLIDNEDEQFAHSEIGREIVHSLLKSSVLGLCYVMSVQAQTEKAVASTDSPTQTPTKRKPAALFNEFLTALQHSRVKHRPVEHYAAEMCITPKYLTVLCKKVSGKTANEWITEYTIADIEYYLRNTDLSIKEISHRLGFESPSFFGRYVRQHLGCTPLGYREGDSNINK